MQLIGKHAVLFSLLLILWLQQCVASGESLLKKARVLAKDDNKEKKVTFRTTLIDSELTDVLWCGNTKESVLVVTELGNVYYSNDSGMNWAKIKAIFQNSSKKQDSNNNEDIGIFDSLVQSPVDPQVVFFIGSEGIHSVSEDCGKTIKTLNTNRSIFDFQFHPVERNWILASTIRLCDQNADARCKISQELYASKDLGEKWQFVTDYVLQFSWAVQDSSFLTNMPAERIIISKDLTKKDSSQQGPWTKDVKMLYSDDFFKTKLSLLKQGQKFLITDQYFFAIRVNDEKSQDVTLFVSSPNTKQYKFQSVELPFEDQLYDRSFIILDTSEGQVFLHVNHEGVKSKYGNIYISDSTGLRYSLSLSNSAKVSNEDICEFEKIIGLEGIYIANVYDPKMVNKIKTEFVGRAFSSRKKSKSDSSSSKGLSKRLKDLDKYKKTKITFDKGGMWQSLRLPKTDAFGEKIECEEKNCSLHLHAATSTRFGPLHNTNNSLGLILGTGNIGKYLSNKQDEINTYLSRDGGKRWFEIKKGSHIYEIGDHGAIIVIASDQKATKEVFCSWNQGLNWSQIVISDMPIEVTDIITEPSNTGQKFIVYGRTSLEGAVKLTKGVLIGVDFSSLHERTCSLPDKPDDPSSDYELWRPGGLKSEQCLMGHQITYVRRKRSAECFNPQEFDPVYSYKNCECTEEDWECDIGYERTEEDGPCLLPQNRQPLYQDPSECNGFYNITAGYRKVAGNTCEGGVNHEPISVPCSPSYFSKVNLLFGVSLLVAALAFLFLIKKRSNVKSLFAKIAYQLSNIKNSFSALNNSKRKKQSSYQKEMAENIKFDDDERVRDVDDDDFSYVGATKRKEI